MQFSYLVSAFASIVILAATAKAQDIPSDPFVACIDLKEGDACMYNLCPPNEQVTCQAIEDGFCKYNDIGILYCDPAIDV
ncbi:uncharacterized protein STEHIDRAFT_161152 [Stereum hirsutum FP-91666 SS1]|uniref:uncharacterized protein n=1 Tax=Stereum hirsutum (strain FP-91666) TaxID=721885 RepID=UPI0004449257|nr:uncharacterized protein STEHIDRAFT_161152 [Stereum hirsutum FP-91666 SS1]EIM81793.1 hypothetical protein STEHIDRAFT_161152 [Stereum hirsutum FP-91666 SS1]